MLDPLINNLLDVFTELIWLFGELYPLILIVLIVTTILVLLKQFAGYLANYDTASGEVEVIRNFIKELDVRKTNYVPVEKYSRVSKSIEGIPRKELIEETKPVDEVQDEIDRLMNKFASMEPVKLEKTEFKPTKYPKYKME